jgi:capsular exopolysaccharide synthesis family protein
MMAGDAEIALPLRSSERARPRDAGRGSWELEHVLRTLRKNWMIAAVFALLTVGTVTAVNLLMKPVFEPTARLEIDPPGSEPFSARDLINAQSDYQDYFNTQSQILKSDELAIAVIRSLKLDREPDIVDPAAADHVTKLGKEISPSRIQLTHLESIAFGALQTRLVVNPVRNTRLVEVSFTSHDPLLAAKVTNAAVDLFIDRNFKTRYEATIQASEWLSGQLSDLRQKVERTNEALVDYQKKNGIVDMGDSHNPVSEKVIELNRQLVQAQADRIQLEAEVKMAASGNADSLPEIRDNPLLQTLTQKYVESRAQLADALTVLGENNSNVKRIGSQVAEFKAQLASERQRVISELRVRYNAGVGREQLMSRAADEMEAIINNTNEKMIRYKALKDDAQTNGQLYNDLVARLKEAGISAGLKSSNMRVVDRARVLDAPTGPHRRRNIALGAVLGLVGGVALALLKETLDTTTHTAEDVMQWTGLASLGSLPFIRPLNGNRQRLNLPARVSRPVAERNGNAASACRVFLDRPKSLEAEAVRSLRASIMLSRPGNTPRVILVASSSPWEGKTTVAVNLALALAQQARTCLIDADLRRPSVARTFGFSRATGLSSVLAGSEPLEGVLRSVPGASNLAVILAGTAYPNPGELVASEPMYVTVRAARERFEFVVLDSPPIVPFSDARALSAFADGVILVARAGFTTRQALTKAVQVLTAVNAPVLGAVVNGVNFASPDYRYYSCGPEYEKLAESEANEA